MFRFGGAITQVLLVAAVFFWGIGTPPLSLGAEGPHIERIILSDADEHLVVYFRLEDAFLNKETNQVIQAGIRTDFTFQAELLQVRALLPAQTLAKVELKKSISYDPLSGKYTVKTRGTGEPAATTTSNLILAQYLMTEVSDLKISPMAKLKKGATLPGPPQGRYPQTRDPPQLQV